MNGEITSTRTLPHQRGCVVVSLRGSETTEASSKCIEKKEIATPACRNAGFGEVPQRRKALRRAGTLPSVARNDEEGLRHSLNGELGSPGIWNGSLIAFLRS
jgi:hypothetical protein